LGQLEIKLEKTSAITLRGDLAGILTLPQNKTKPLAKVRGNATSSVQFLWREGYGLPVAVRTMARLEDFWSMSGFGQR